MNPQFSCPNLGGMMIGKPPFISVAPPAEANNRAFMDGTNYTFMDGTQFDYMNP